jgi:hypothetical protein
MDFYIDLVGGGICVRGVRVGPLIPAPRLRTSAIKSVVENGTLNNGTLF